MASAWERITRRCLKGGFQSVNEYHFDIHTPCEAPFVRPVHMHN